MIHAVIVAVHGLMVETEAAARDSWVALYQDHGEEFPPQAWSVVLGGSGREFYPIAYRTERVGWPPDAAALREHKQRLVAEQPLLPGVAISIVDARRLGLALGVASSSLCAWAL